MATELANEHPAHIAAAWLGHSVTVASKHYWQVTDADLARASSQTTRNPTRAGAEPACNESQPGFSTPSEAGPKHKKSPAFRDVSATCETLQKNHQTRAVGDEGLEPSPQSTGKTAIRGEGGAESGALGANGGSQGAILDADLQTVVDSWPTLPEPIKAGILAMIRAAGGAK